MVYCDKASRTPGTTSVSREAAQTSAKAAIRGYTLGEDTSDGGDKGSDSSTPHRLYTDVFFFSLQLRNQSQN
jgi:hypothetical protein